MVRRIFQITQRVENIEEFRFADGTVVTDVNELLDPSAPTPDYNEVFGTEGDDRPLEGGDGDDKIYGLGGSDDLIGHGGNDYLIAGSGPSQSMRGGAGNDIFEFGVGDQLVRIKDFTQGEDEIALRDGITFADFAVTEGPANVLKLTYNNDVLIIDARGTTLDVNDIGASDFDTL